MIPVLRGTLSGPLWLPSKAAAPPSTLMNDLAHYWRLDEESGARADAIGSNHLTDNNTVGYAAGKHNNAASFISANSEYLSAVVADIAAAGADWSGAFWVYHTGQDYATLLGTYTGAAGFGVFSRGNGTLDFYVLHGSGVDRVIVNVPCTPNAWHHVYIEWRHATNTAGIAVDNGALQTGISVNGYTFASGFRIGGNLPGLVDLTGKMDEPAFWSRGLTADERPELWNGSAGKFLNGAGDDFE